MNYVIMDVKFCKHIIDHKRSRPRFIRACSATDFITFTFSVEGVLCVKVTNMWALDVVSDNFQASVICTSGNCAQNWITELYANSCHFYWLFIHLLFKMQHGL
jgi:hypothetical protein